jgi:hypothetical protein
MSLPSPAGSASSNLVKYEYRTVGEDISREVEHGLPEDREFFREDEPVTERDRVQ